VRERQKRVESGTRKPAGTVRVRASRELLAAPEDAYRFCAEPHHLPDWWPGTAGLQPDRRGAGAGARWQVVGGGEPTLFRRPRAQGTLVVTAAEPSRLFAFHLVADRLDVRVELEPAAAGRTRATLTVEGPWLVAYRRTLARRALARLHALCQTAATLDD
jgi:uncharacterized protein YndB with AHSA1/START domain